MASIEDEFEKIERERSWQQVFVSIRHRSEQHGFSTKEAKKGENRNLNRYGDVSPYDHSRVVLHRSDVDYINASVVPVVSAGRNYILTQGPLAATLHHFWLMVWEKDTKGIVMLNKLIEKNAVKCHQYWPDADQREMTFKSVDLKVSFVAESAKENYICRTFRLHDVKTDATRDVWQFHYVNWPDFGVPQSPDDFLDFLDDVRRSGCLGEDVGPAVVHCSAGIGRSGTFCLVDSILKMIEEGRQESDIKLQDVLVEMRRFRMMLIQTAEQLRFSYLAIIEALRRRNDRSPFLSRKGGGGADGVADDVPPPPPHRGSVGNHHQPVPDARDVVILVNNAAAVSSSEEEDDDDDGGDNEHKNNRIGAAGDAGHVANGGDSSESQDSAVSSEMSSDDEDSDGDPPPLPPRDIPATDSLLSPEDSPSRFEQEPLNGGATQESNTATRKTSEGKTATLGDDDDNNGDDDLSWRQQAGRDTSRNHGGDRTVTEELERFEQEILANETMQPQTAACCKPGPSETTSSDLMGPAKPQEAGEQEASVAAVAAASGDAENELRQRRRQRDEKLIEKINTIKKGIADSEAAHQRRAIFGKIGIGFVVLFGTGILMYRLYSFVRS